MDNATGVYSGFEEDKLLLQMQMESLSLKMLEQDLSIGFGLIKS